MTEAFNARESAASLAKFNLAGDEQSARVLLEACSFEELLSLVKASRFLVGALLGVMDQFLEPRYPYCTPETLRRIAMNEARLVAELTHNMHQAIGEDGHPPSQMLDVVAKLLDEQ